MIISDIDDRLGVSEKVGNFMAVDLRNRIEAHLHPADILNRSVADTVLQNLYKK
jgi:hypothetical protein